MGKKAPFLTAITRFFSPPKLILVTFLQKSSKPDLSSPGLEPCGLAGQSRLAQLFSCSQGDLRELHCCFSSEQDSEWIKEIFP